MDTDPAELASTALPAPAARNERVAAHVRGLIEDGTFRAGDRVPSLRAISRRFGVSMTTAIRAYERLEAAGWLEARPQAGFFVRSAGAVPLRLPAAGAPPAQPRRLSGKALIDTLAADPGQAAADAVTLSLALPDPAFLPINGLQHATRRALRKDPHVASGYTFPPGLEPLRRQVATRVAVAGARAHPDEVVITNGCTEALSLALQCVAAPGDVVAVESPTFFNVLTLIESLGLRVLELPTDPATGLHLDALERRLAEQGDVAAVLSIASFANPLGSCMPDDHRRRLAGIAARHRVPVIEDDIYGDLHFGDTRPALVRAFDEDGWVLSAGSFSKTIAPGYRVGWLLGGRWLEEAVSRKHASSMASASLPQQAIAGFLADGAYDRHLRRTRARYREQVQRMRDAIARHFPSGTRVTDPRGGFLLWVQLPDGADGLAVHGAAQRERIHVAPGHLFSTGHAYDSYLRLSCGVPWSDRLEAAVRRLGEIVSASAAEPARLE